MKFRTLDFRLARFPQDLFVRHFSVDLLSHEKARLLLQIPPPTFSRFGAVEPQSFSKRGSPRSASNIGSSRSSAGVSAIPVASAPLPGVESIFSKAAMARSGWPMRAATRAKISIACGTFAASVWDDRAAIPRSARDNAPVSSPRPIATSARSPTREAFSGCSISNDSSSRRASTHVCWAAALSPATSCAQPNQKRTSPLR